MTNCKGNISGVFFLSLSHLQHFVSCEHQRTRMMATPLQITGTCNKIKNTFWKFGMKYLVIGGGDAIALEL